MSLTPSSVVCLLIIIVIVATTPNVNASQPQTINLNILGSTIKTAPEETVQSVLDKVNTILNVDLDRLCDQKGNAVMGIDMMDKEKDPTDQRRPKVGDVWKVKDVEVALNPIRYFYHDELKEAFVCANDVKSEGDLLKALAIDTTRYCAPDFKSSMERNRKSTPLYILEKDKKQLMKQVIDHFGHTHYFEANTYSELDGMMKARFGALEHPVWLNDTKPHFCDKDGNLVNTDASQSTTTAATTIFKAHHVMVFDNEGSMMVPVCKNETYTSLLSRLYPSANVDELRVDGVADLNTPIASDHIASKYPVKSAIEPLLVLQPASPDTKYDIAVGKEHFVGVVNSITSSHFRSRLADNLKMMAIFRGGDAGKYVTFDRGLSQAICDGDGNDVSLQETLPVTADTDTIQLSAKPVTLELGNSFTKFLFFFNTHEQVTFTVCDKKNDAASIRTRLAAFFYHPKSMTLNVQLDGKLQSIYDMKDEDVLSVFGGKAVKVEADLAYRLPTFNVSSEDFRSVDDLYNSATMVAPLRRERFVKSTPFRRLLVGVIIVLVALIIASLVYYFTTEDHDTSATSNEHEKGKAGNESV